MIWWNSKADSIVWMREEKLIFCIDIYMYFYAYYITCTQKISSKIDLFELLFFPNELKLGGVQNATNYEKN